MPDPRRYRVLALLSHPIQYLVPLMRKMAAHPRIELGVYFMDDTGLRSGYVEGMGRTMKWDVPLLDGYRHTFLKNLSPNPDSRAPTARINPGILAALARERPDAIYMHAYTSLTEAGAFLAAKALRIPVLFFGDVVIDAQHARPPLLRAAFRRAFCASIDAALLPSSRARAFYERYGLPADRMFWAPLCVDNDYWFAKSAELRPRRAELRRELGVDPDAPVVLFVANMRQVKRPLDALEAFTKMKTRASLIMVGEGPLLADVEAYVAEKRPERVVLAGARNQSELPKYYAAADVFLMTSEHEVNPLVVREAMCSRLPLVLSDTIEVIADFVREGENGYGFPKGDTAAAAARLDAVVVDPEKCAAMGARSVEIITPWSYDVTVAGVCDALDRVVKR